MGGVHFCQRRADIVWQCGSNPRGTGPPGAMTNRAATLLQGLQPRPQQLQQQSCLCWIPLAVWTACWSGQALPSEPALSLSVRPAAASPARLRSWIQWSIAGKEKTTVILLLQTHHHLLLLTGLGVTPLLLDLHSDPQVSTPACGSVLRSSSSTWQT